MGLIVEVTLHCGCLYDRVAALSHAVLDMDGNIYPYGMKHPSQALR